MPSTTIKCEALGAVWPKLDMKTDETYLQIVVDNFDFPFLIQKMHSGEVRKVLEEMLKTLGSMYILGSILPLVSEKSILEVLETLIKEKKIQELELLELVTSSIGREYFKVRESEGEEND